MLHFLVKILINIIFENNYTDPDSNIIDTRLQILNPEFLNPFRIDPPNSNRFFPATKFFLSTLLIPLTLRLRLLSPGRTPLDNLNKKEAFLQTFDLFLQSLHIFNVRESKPELLPPLIRSPSIALHGQVPSEFLLDFHNNLNNFLPIQPILPQKNTSITPLLPFPFPLPLLPFIPLLPFPLPYILFLLILNIV